MKFRKPGQILLATAASALVGLGLTSCGQSNTIDFLYVLSNKSTPGQIYVYWVDQESGAPSKIPDSPYPAGNNPVGEVASPNGKYLYVINHDDNTLVEYAIGTDAKLYPQQTCQTPGSDPEALALSQDGTKLFVADTYAPAPAGQAAYSETNPGPGALVEYQLSVPGNSVANSNNQKTAFGGGLTSCTPVANGSLQYWPLGNFPGGVFVAPNNGFVYAVNTGSLVTTTTVPTSGTPITAPTSGAGSISAYAIGSNGALTAISGSPFSAGTAPTAVAIDPTSRFLYVTDSALNQVIEYTIQSTGILTPLNPGIVSTGTLPDGITVDPRGLYVYVANYTDGTISTYNINTSTGTLSANATPTLKTGPGSTCVIVEPSLDRFVFTSNFLENEVSSALLNPDTGSLTTDQNSPYPTGTQPTCVVAVAHGNHSTENVSGVAPGNS
jgi:6-phosphogluconolactonase